MRRKEQYADEIIEMLERTKCGAWASNINLNTKDRVIEVCQNCVDTWSGRKFKDHCTTPPQALEQTTWIPVSERLPKDLEPVNITWVNHNPESYYADIKDKPFTATGVYFNGQWYWWSTLCTDILAEYSHNYDDVIDDDIEITAWMPLPPCYEPQESEVQDADSD